MASQASAQLAETVDREPVPADFSYFVICLYRGKTNEIRVPNPFSSHSPFETMAIRQIPFVPSPFQVAILKQAELDFTRQQRKENDAYAFYVIAMAYALEFAIPVPHSKSTHHESCCCHDNSPSPHHHSELPHKILWEFCVCVCLWGVSSQLSPHSLFLGSPANIDMNVGNVCWVLAAHWIDEGMVKRIRRIAFSTKVSPQTGNGMIYAARLIFNSFIPDVHIFSDVRTNATGGSSPGYGISLVAEATTSCLISADLAVGDRKTDEMEEEMR